MKFSRLGWRSAQEKRGLLRILTVSISVLICTSALLLVASDEAQARKLVIGSVEPGSEVENQVRIWIGQLAAQQPFAAWKQATPEIQALGPGTHSWLATLKTKQQSIVGYLIVHATPDGTLQLGEYGVGPNPLFDRSALDRTLAENGLIDAASTRYTAVPYYAHPFAAVWQVAIGPDNYWVDAKTSEILPLHASEWNQLKLPLLTMESAGNTSECSSANRQANQTCPWIDAVWVGEAFDPYERLPWVSGARPQSLANTKEAQRLVQSRLHLTYVTEPYGESVLYAVPVTGFLRFTSGRLDLAVEMSGTRFLPLSILQQLGHFYK